MSNISPGGHSKEGIELSNIAVGDKDKVKNGSNEHSHGVNVVESSTKTKMVIMPGMKGYWKEINDKNEIISICRKDKSDKNDGICYFYKNGVIERASEWKNGKELSVVKRFEGKKMTEFENGVKRYEGGYLDSVQYGYLRNGEGEEYDGKGWVIREGYWIMGHRRSYYVWKLLICYVVLIALCFVTGGIALALNSNSVWGWVPIAAGGWSIFMSLNCMTLCCVEEQEAYGQYSIIVGFLILSILFYVVGLIGSIIEYFLTLR